MIFDRTQYWRGTGGGGGRVQSVSVVDVHASTLENLSASLTVLPTTHLFGHNGTMMTRANSRAGRRGAYSFCRSRSVDHISTQASPHTGFTAPPPAMARDGRTPRSRSDRVTESRVGSRASARRRPSLCQAPSAGVFGDRSDPTRRPAARHESPLHTTETATSH